jgi:hypothetical protein
MAVEALLSGEEGKEEHATKQGLLQFGVVIQKDRDHPQKRYTAVNAVRQQLNANMHTL